MGLLPAHLFPLCKCVRVYSLSVAEQFFTVELLFYLLFLWGKTEDVDVRIWWIHSSSLVSKENPLLVDLMLFVQNLTDNWPSFFLSLWLLLFTESISVHPHCPGHRYGREPELRTLQHSHSSHLHHRHQRQSPRVHRQDGESTSTVSRHFFHRDYRLSSDIPYFP